MRGHRVGDDAAPHAGVHAVVEGARPRRSSRPGRAGWWSAPGSPMSQLPESAITITSAASRSWCSSRNASSVGEPTSSSPSTKHGDADRQVVAVRADRGQVRGDAGLVVGGAAAVEPVAALGRLERLAVPVGRVADRLHVVVGVEQHRRRALRARACGPPRPERRPPPVRICTSSNPSARNSSAVASADRRTSSARAGSALTDGIRTRASRSARTEGSTSLHGARGAGQESSSCDVMDATAYGGRASRRSSAEAAAAPGRSARRTPRSRPSRSASAHARSPTASAIQVAASISTTAGGVPRVCRVPADALGRGVRRHPHLDRPARRLRDQQRQQVLGEQPQVGAVRGAVAGTGRARARPRRGRRGGDGRARPDHPARRDLDHRRVIHSGSVRILLRLMIL